MNDYSLHKPVLRDETLASLDIVSDGIYIDGTFGRGGHSREVLNALNAKGRLLAVDADLTAVAHAQQHFAEDDRFSIHHSNFSHLGRICEEEGVVGRVNGVLLDLGVSSPQLDNAERGFSFMQDGPLDMRMDTSSGVPANVWLANASETEMADVFWQYGEERYSRRIARALVEQRKNEPFESTLVLAEVVKAAHPRWEKHKHPATRVFQAIRIYINRELDSITEVLTQLVDVLAEGGRLVVISFHSLEDRLVKRFLRGDHVKSQPLRGLPFDMPQVHWPLKTVGKAIKASDEELCDNPRARSAVLRVAEKCA